ncbi:hypothetical protein EPUL_002941, partial [Erysiphe pulchra]
MRASTSPTNVIQSEQTPATLLTLSRIDKRGYECGNVFFTHDEVQEVLLRVINYAQDKSRTIHEYRGPLYSDSLSSEYLMWPIKKESRVIINNEFTKCIKRDGSPTKPSASVSDGTNAYECGYEVLSDQQIEEATILARSNMRLGNKYPIPYFGTLFPEASGYLIWPVLYGKRLYTKGREAGPIFIVLNKEGKLIDTVVRGYSKNFLRCARIRKIPNAPISDPYNKLFVPPPRPGFQCGRIFFEKKSLDEAAREAKLVIFRNKRKRYPTEYNGHPFNQKCWLWPILNNGKLSKKGMIGPYRVVITPDYEVLGAVIVSEKVLGPDRVVINTECEVVGALTTIDINQEKKFV